MDTEYLMTGKIDGINYPDELLQAYTALFLFLGGSMSMDPEKSGLPHLCDTGMLRNLPVSSSNSRFMLASRLLKSPCPLKQQCHLKVGENYKYLFEGNGSAAACPAASHWHNNGISIEEHHRQLNVLYSRYGCSKTEECSLEPDHLGIELLFTNLMLEKYLTENDYEIRAIIRKDLIDFINGEMLVWLPLWAEKVTLESVTKCYIGISGLIIGGLEDVRDILSRQKLGL